MADPFTIRIFVPDGDPEGVRIIDRMNWTGVGIVFPRSKWQEVRNRSEFARPGVYILVGYRGEDDDLPTVYIGQGDGTKGRIDQHLTQKVFWDRAIAFASTSGGLNRAHITWLEYALVNRAAQTKQCHLDNGNVPQEPALTEVALTRRRRSPQALPKFGETHPLQSIAMGMIVVTARTTSEWSHTWSSNDPPTRAGPKELGP